MIKQMPDGSYQAGRLMKDPETNQEIMVMGFGVTRGDALLDLDKALGLEEIRFPGLKAVVPNQIPLDRLLGVEMEMEDREPGYRKSWTTEQAPPLWVKSTISTPEGRESSRVIDWNDRESRRRAQRAAVKALEEGGRFVLTAAIAMLEGGAK